MTAVQQPLDGMPEPGPTARQQRARRRVEDYETWVDEVWGAFVRAADTGLPFTTSEIQLKEDLPDPPSPQAHWGKLPGRLVKAGLIEAYSAGKSKRDTVHGSLVNTWIGVPAHRRRAAA